MSYFPQVLSSTTAFGVVEIGANIAVVNGVISLGTVQITGALGYTPLSAANNLSDLASVATARTNLGLVASATTDTTNAANISSGTLAAGRLPALTGDVTTTAGSAATVIAANAVTNAKAAQAAANTIKGNNTGATANVADLTVSQVTTLLGAGAASGLATLDGTGKVPTSQLPASVTGAMAYQGTWNASTNTPTLTSGSGTKGFIYKVATAGTTTVDGVSQWNVGDQIVFDGTTWDKIDGIPSEVVSVAGRSGAVVLASTDVSGLAASATTDTTNAANISSGTIPTARLPAATGAALGAVIVGANINVSGGTISLNQLAITNALAYTPMNPSNNLGDISSNTSARTNLGLGTIATQAASAVALTGGTIAGVNISYPIRVVTAAGNVTMVSGDSGGVIVLNKTTGAATTVTLIGSPATGATVEIKDGKGDASTNNITITPAAGTIDGAITFVMASNYSAIELVYNGTQWNII